MTTRRRLTTDYGTVVFHTLFVVAFFVLTATGLRIASDDPNARWLAVLDPVLPTEHLWFRHLAASVIFTAALAAYVFYLRAARLGSRVRFDLGRVAMMLRGGPTKWAAINIAVYWTLMAAFIVGIVSGTLLFLEYGEPYLWLHLQATYVAIACVFLHVSLHAASGGTRQLLRIIRPGELRVPEPPPDLAELLAKELARRQEFERDDRSLSVANEPLQTRRLEC